MIPTCWSPLSIRIRHCWDAHHISILGKKSPLPGLSGGGRPRSRVGGLFTVNELGAEIILQKPFEMNDLLRLVAAALNHLER
jgi:hypothetical protein